MIAAAIDIGTNSTRYLIAEGKHHEIAKILSRGGQITRLGKGIGTQNILNRTAVQKTIYYLSELKTIFSEFNIKRICIVSTSIARDFRETSFLLNQTQNLFQTSIKTLSGEEEAKLAFLGAKDCIKLNTHNLIIDIGGGSTELIFSPPDETLQLFSLQLGSVRLTEQFIVSDPPKASELNSAKTQIHKIITDTIPSFPRVDHLVGTAGTLTTLGAIYRELEMYEPDKIHQLTLKDIEIQAIFDRLILNPLAKRKNIPGLEPLRADIIIAGTLILIAIMKKSQVSNISISDHGILFGLVKEALS